MPVVNPAYYVTFAIVLAAAFLISVWFLLLAVIFLVLSVTLIEV